MNPQMPDHVLQRQVCHECFHYLSVPPVSVNSRGENICGRCVKKSIGEKYTSSLFNTLAKGFMFKCTNHFSGCIKILHFSDVEKHEETCCYNYETHDCFFCSFSGSLTQILNHSVKIHPENVSFDGIIPFSLSDSSLLKNVLVARLFVMKKNIIFVTIKVTKDVFRLVFKAVTKNFPSTVNQYVVKFFEKENVFLLSEYGWLSNLSIDLETSFEKNTEQLVGIFGPGAKLNCQVLIDSFTLEEKELELQRRIINLRNSEDILNTSRRELGYKQAELASRQDNYESALQVIKKMSPKFFTCCGCEALSSETYYCPNLHCYCEGCFSNFCYMCNIVTEFEKFPELEKLRVSCDWPRCNENVSIKAYLTHKPKCLLRPYECPLKNCKEVLFSAEKLVKHWHGIPALIVNDTLIQDSLKCAEYYWLLANNDLFHVLIEMNDKDIKVIIEKINVLNNTNCFKSEGYSLYYKNWLGLNMVDFCGKWVVKEVNQYNITSLKFFF